MRIVDVDAHLHEPLDWVEQTSPSLAEALGPPARFMDVAPSVFGAIDGKTFSTLPEAQRPKSPEDVILPGFIRHLEMTDERQPDGHDPEVDAPIGYFDADARLAFCDKRGIDVQFLNPTFLVGAIVQAARTGRMELMKDVRQTWNTWSLGVCDGHTDRLIPVTQIDLHDLDWSLKEMERTRALGSRAFVIPEAPVGGGRGQPGRSITHPDFEPLWDAAEDLEMAAFAHVGFARERINPAWANNGTDDVRTYSVLNMIAGSVIGPQLMLAAMAFDGLFERHPKLTVVVEEVGIDWLPHLVTQLDLAIGITPEVLHDEEFRPSHLIPGSSYTLPLTPVEYLRRQVRVTPLPATHPIRPIIDAIPHELLCFSSDYPHVEGAAEAVELCQRQLADLPQNVQEDFFGNVGELIGV